MRFLCPISQKREKFVGVVEIVSVKTFNEADENTGFKQAMLIPKGSSAFIYQTSSRKSRTYFSGTRSDIRIPPPRPY